MKEVRNDMSNIGNVGKFQSYDWKYSDGGWAHQMSLETVPVKVTSTIYMFSSSC